MQGATQDPMTPGAAAVAPRDAAAVLLRGRSDARRLAVLFLGAFLLRWFLAARGEVIFNDGPRFIDIAKAFVAGETDRALSHVYHPLYSWLAAKVYPLFGDYERAALAVSVTAGTLAGLPLWFLLRDLFGRRVAWVGLVLWAVHPFAAEYAANVQNDAVYLLFFLAAVAFLWRGLAALPARSAAVSFALAGASSALAYLTRPEGFGVVVLGAFWLVAGLWKARHSSQTLSVLASSGSALASSESALASSESALASLGTSGLGTSGSESAVASSESAVASSESVIASSGSALAALGTSGLGTSGLGTSGLGTSGLGTSGSREIPARVLAGVLLVVTFLTISFPYLRHIHDTTGTWQLTRKKSLSSLAGVKRYDQPAWAKDRVKDEVTAKYGRPPMQKKTRFEIYGVRGMRLFVTFGEELTWPLLLFLLLGLAVRGRALRRTRGDLFLLSFFVLYGFTLYRLAVTLGYAGRRHMFSLALLALGWTGLGVVTLSRRLEATLAARGSAWGRRAGVLLLGLVVAVSLAKTLRTNVNEPIGEKQAGRWIREQAMGKEVRVFAPRERILYYAQARYVRVPLRFTYAPSMAYLRRYGVEFVVTSDSMTDVWYPRFLEDLRPEDLKLEARFAERIGSHDQYRIYRLLYPEGRPTELLPLPRSMQFWSGG